MHIQIIFPQEKQWEQVRTLTLEALIQTPEAFTTPYHDAKKLSESHWKSLLTSKNTQNKLFLVAKKEGDFIAMIRATKKTAHRWHVLSLYVTPTERK